MIFRRLLVRERLTLLATIPLIAIVTMAVPLVAIQIDNARESTAVSSRIDAAAKLGRLVLDLERERLLSVVYLDLPNGRTAPLITQSETVRDGVTDTRTALGKRLSAGIADGLDAMGALDTVRAQVLNRTITGDAVNAEFTEKITAVIDSLDLVGGPAERSLLALLQAGERSNNAAATMLAALGAPGSSDLAATTVSSSLAVERTQIAEFKRLASPGQIDLLDQVERGAATRQIAELETSFLADPRGFSTSGQRDTLVGQVHSAVDSHFRLRGLVLDKIANDLASDAANDAANAVRTAVVFSGIAISMVIAIFALSVVIGRSVSRPLRRLTVAADRVSELANAELVRVADEDRNDLATPRLAAVDVQTQDEIGDLAAAINRVQAVAALLLERQVVSRRNVAVMFGNVGRRTQNLVGRQLSLIDSLERNEQDAELLQQLYRLDHLSSRLRRNANSLLVLSGVVEQLGALPQLLVDLLRSALGEIEDFQRVAIGKFDEATLRPGAPSDVALLLAELLENATSFSPPTTEVHVSAMVGPEGCRVFVVDHGIGMSTAQLAQENERLVHRERLDITPTDVLGLFVVGRLARRHGIDVTLRPTPGGGTTAEILLPPALLVSSASDVGPDVVTAGQQEPEIAPAAVWSPPTLTTPVAPASVEPDAAPAMAILNRRVRGAQMPKTDRTGRERLRWGLADTPETARAVVEQFESGVQRAAGQSPQPGAPAWQEPHPRPTPDALPSLPGRRATGDGLGTQRAQTQQAQTQDVQTWINAFRRSTQSTLDQLASMTSPLNGSQNSADATPMPSWFARAKDGVGVSPPPGEHTEGVEVAPTLPPPPGATGLRRRVRGANMPAATLPAKRSQSRIGQPEDPEAARDFVLDVEAGIDQATRDIGGNRKPEETSS